MELSKNGSLLASQMIRELSQVKYTYSKIVEGCFDYCIYRYGMPPPEETKELIVSEVLRILQSNFD